MLTSTNLKSGNINSKYIQIPTAVLIHKDGIFVNAWINIEREVSGFDDQIEYMFKCLHCYTLLYDFHKSGFSENCDECNWKNELIETYKEEPILVLYDYLDYKSTQICYPEIVEADLDDL